MLDREKLTQHVDDPLTRQILVKVLDKVESVLRKHEVKVTDFLTPHQIKLASDMVRILEGISYFETGGYEGAERRVIVLFPDYLEPAHIEIPLGVLEARGSSQFTHVSHRDYLGAILGLGLRREKVGDLLLHQEGNKHFCHMIVHEELQDYILYHFQKVGNVSVSLKEIPLTQIKPPEIEYREASGSVASLRLDAVIGLGFKLSRADAQAFISKELVSVNWEVIGRNYHEVASGDHISVRGKGRMEILSVEGTTRSGRLRIAYRKPI